MLLSLLNRWILVATLVLLSLLAGCLESTMAAEPDGILSRAFVYETAPFPSCHASTMAEGKAGLVMAWFGGEYEKHPSVGIWSARLVEGKWTAPVEVANGNQPDGKRLPCWNPVLFQPHAKDGGEAPLLLFYKVGPDPETWWGMLRTSTDGGVTWSEARRLPEGILGPIKNKPVQLPNGDILSPTSTETPTNPSDWRVHFELSSDMGQTWIRSQPAASIPEINAIQPSILFHGDGKLQAVGRSRSGKVFETWSSDAGKTWSALTLTALPNPNSGTDAVTLKDGRHLIVYNHTPKGRSPLNVAVSTDGKNWKPVLDLENEPGEYSYPAIIQTKDGLIHISYTWKRQRIQHVTVDPAKL